MKELICIVCPRGCRLTVDDDLNVTGNFCPRGAVYGKQEVTNPTRVITSIVRIEGSDLAMCPVKTSAPIKKGNIFKAMEEINKVKINAPIHIGDVIIKDICGEEGVDLVATRNMEAI
ncbi:MAG: DUF1667 domain-containing protein [Bacilli bacterium]|nr:DUF1667 domain-containing protein [Bacilli bacterium]